VIAVAGFTSYWTNLQVAAAVPQVNPAFGTILPAERKAIQSLGIWYQVHTKHTGVSYAYPDSVDRVSIIVSEQPLPSNFKVDTDEHVARLAHSYQANYILTSKGTTIHIGTAIDRQSGQHTLHSCDQSISRVLYRWGTI
jgi:hypothetical protein